MGEDDWADPEGRALAVALDGRMIEDEDGETSPDRFLLLLNAAEAPVTFALPSGRARWRVVLTSGEPDETPELTAERTVTVEGRALLLMQSS
jgi:glycogen operon protein